MTNKALNDKIRERYLKILSDYFDGNGEEVLRTNSNEICLPCVDEEGNEKFIQIVVKIPTGSRDGEPFDGYSMQEDYQMKTAEKAEKAKIAEEKKQQKIAKDKEKQKKLAENKAKRSVAKD